ncbi:F-actin-monooxygenase Mical isoform X4 [Nasonia vitripennis]|uniref:F-actin monooxygenase n=1 Tax=Nasonia vitripennis TaxID=7425 RepID=A0A7M7TED7_NASVI|nr:F-actin-monooxygenase Mical isoform X4 [Nasonia vitripennis]
MDHLQHLQHQQNRKQMVSPDVALASEVFDQFCNATTLKSILGHFRHLCDLLKIKPTNFHQFYPKLKSKLRSWKAQALWKKFDQRANHKCYNRGKACLNTRVLIIGGGPCGMRSAIEAQLLGAKVVVVEKRDRMSRNNVLHLWPFVIQDLRGLGAKKFFGKFCAGSIDHISIRQLQCILLKVALILGVEFHENVSFEQLVPPPEDQEGGKIGWRAKTVPADHPVSQYEFDVLIGADGKRNTLEGFKRKEFRGKLAIAITANFINKRTEAEARVEEISGVAFIFNQKFFKELYSETGIDLENIVYYKDDTHYFVMTAKKHSLIDKGVIIQDHADTAKLLAKENVDREALMLYAREAAEFSTEYQMMDMEFAVNHYGQPDVAMFDFTSMYAAENASRVLERRGHRLLMILVGDSLLEPFWPTGSGCARGFLSSMDACWAIKEWGASLTPLEVIAERESIYRLLGQTTPENLNRDYAAYTLDPHTRYPNLNVRSVTSAQVRSLLDTDDPETFKLSPVQTAIDLPKKRRRKDSQVHPDTLLHWLQRQVALYDGVRIHDMGVSFKSGLAIAAIIHRYRPDLIDYHALKKDDPVTNNQVAFDILEKELGIPAIMTGEEMVQCEVPDKLTMFSYLTQIYEAFRGEIPHIKHPKLEPETEDRPTFSQKLSELTAEQKAHLLGRITKQDVPGTRARRSRHVNENLPLPMDKKPSADTLARRHARKRRSTEKMGATVEERTQRLQDIEKNRLERMLRRQYQRKRATQQFYKSMQMLQANAKRDKDEPFEDYSIFLYRQTAPDFKDRVKDLEQKILYPDREPKLHAGHHRGSIDEGFSGRIKNIEEKLKGTAASEKKPKDLLRAIGKIEKTDWNVKEIEKKIEENKMGRGVRHDRVERVPKWSREQFLARQTKMEKKGREPMETDSKYADIDSTLKSIDRKIKEGNVLGHNKVSAMAEQFANKNQEVAAAASAVEQPKVQRSNSKAAITLPAQGGSEMCHFCDKRVYLMERLTAEGKSFHRGCFRCEYCSTSLRIGNHTFDRDKNGGRFYCTQHFGLPGTMKTRIEKKKAPLTNKENIPQTSNNHKAQDKAKISLEGISGLDLLDRGQTPERIEFENLAGISDAEEAQSIMDEDEWTDRNFGPSAAEMGSSDDISDMSDSDDDNEVFEEAIDQPLTTEGTLELAKNWTLRYSHPHPAAAHSDTGSNEYEDSSDEYTSTEEDSHTATEDEEDVRARELRKKEVWLQVPPRSSDTETGSETEIASDEESSEESEENSATEISTDSEFEHDGTTPTQHGMPHINDSFVRKTRGDYAEPKKVQVKSKILWPAGVSSVNGNVAKNNENSNKKQHTKQQQQTSKLNALNERPSNAKNREPSNELNSNLTSITQNSKIITSTPLINPRKGDYLLNRTHSTEGIASKLSLELKKRYLLGGSGLGGSVMKSGSTSNVDTRLRNLSDAISQHQKLLNPAPEPSPTMQAFLQGQNKLRTGSTGGNQPAISPLSPSVLFGSSSPVKAFPFERKAAPSLNSTAANFNAKNVQLPDLIKETSNLKDLEVAKPLPSKPAIIEEKPSPTEPSEPPKEPDITSLKIETPTPTVETRTVEDVPYQNGDTAQSNQNDLEMRPRSPLHETSIIVPDIDWKKTKQENEQPEKLARTLGGENDIDSSDTSSEDSDELDSDSLSTSDGEEEEQANKLKQTIPLSPPRLQIHSTEGDLLLDAQVEKHHEDGMTFEPDSIECSYLLEDPNRPPSHPPSPPPTAPLILPPSLKELESVNTSLKQLQLQDERRGSLSPTTTSRASSKNDDSEENDVTTAAYTETEFSEWARDGDDLVSEDLRDVEYDMNPEFQGKGKRPSNDRMLARMANGEDLTDVELDYSQEEMNADRTNTQYPSTIASKMLANGEEDIGFMDTDNESLLDEDSLKEVSRPKNRGYIEFVNFKAPQTPVKLSSGKSNAPIAKSELEYDDASDAQTPCCEDNVIEFAPITMDDVRDRLRHNQNGHVVNGNGNMVCQIKIADCEKDDHALEVVNKDLMSLSMEEDSLLIVEPAEDTTTSEVVTILASPNNPTGGSIVSCSKNEDTTTSENTKTPEPAPTFEYINKSHDDANNPDYLEYVKRLQSRIAEFSNAKDSIDIRKSKRKSSKPSTLQTRTAEMIAEEIKCQATTAGLGNGLNSPATSRKLEEITRERTKQKSLIQDLLMDKLEAHKQKSAEKKAKRAARTASFTRLTSSPPMRPPETPTNFVPASIGDGTPQNNSAKGVGEIKTQGQTNGERPLSIFRAMIMDDSVFDKSAQQLDDSVFTTPSKASSAMNSESRAEIDFKTPIAPPRFKHEEARKTAEKARQDARERARLKSDEDLGLSPEDRIKELRMKVSRRQLKSETDGDTPAKSVTKRYSFGLHKSPSGLHNKLQTSKSTDNVKAMAARRANSSSSGQESSVTAKSLDELLGSSDSPKEEVQKRDKSKKPKDPERRKSIIQAVSDFFKKKDSLSPPGKDGSNNKLSMFRLTPKSKEKGKLDKLNPQFDKRPKSVCEGMLNVGSFFIESPPPVPPPPINYTMPTNVSDDSLSDEDSKTAALSISQLNKTSNTADGSCNSIPRKVKTAKRMARQAQLKRLRMAQEIQRKLEETEVKQRELESRGVSVEKALRGEGECSDREEADLLREWFDLMRERTELRRYEKELLVRAQEVQLEDRHDRLQQELRERLADDDEKKTSADVKKEGEILTEMLEIVAKRDSLIALLEEERQRWRRPSCPTLIAPTTLTSTDSSDTQGNSHVSYTYILLAIIVAYTLSSFLTEFFISSHKESIFYFI